MATVSVDKCPRCQSPRVSAAFKSISCSYYNCSDCGYMWDKDVAEDVDRQDDRQTTVTVEPDTWRDDTAACHLQI